MKFLHYNIFAKSLSSNSIPWVMNIAIEWKIQIESLTQLTYTEWMKRFCHGEYLSHFHKNYHSGDKSMMRFLWGREITHQDDIPTELHGLSFHSEHRVRYNQEGNEMIATTLPGILKISVPEIANELYQHIIEVDDYYKWEFRGPKVFQEIVGNNPDLISLCEYDIHHATASYRNPLSQETFYQAMLATGYSGFLLKSPGVRELSGLGFYWKTDSFDVICNNSPNSLPNIIDCSNVDEITGNYDLGEYWHKLILNDEGLPVGSKYEELQPKDRRNVGFIRLRHKQTNKVLLVVCSHLMTTSRDGPNTNEFPGEVRALEMEFIGQKIQQYIDRYPSIHGIIYAADFNIDVRDLKKFQAPITSIIDPTKELHFRTGYHHGSSKPTLVYHSNERYHLEEAFESIHAWGGGTGKEKNCTSFNRERCEWIDMLWYTPKTLVLNSISSMQTPPSPIPDQNHGSDHLPLWAEFDFVENLDDELST
jgi:mRNA deadenylase 3'-5' endonuclease subunit Ccr4